MTTATDPADGGALYAAHLQAIVCGAGWILLSEASRAEIKAKLTEGGTHHENRA